MCLPPRSSRAISRRRSAARCQSRRRWPISGRRRSFARRPICRADPPAIPPLGLGHRHELPCRCRAAVRASPVKRRDLPRPVDQRLVLMTWLGLDELPDVRGSALRAPPIEHWYFGHASLLCLCRVSWSDDGRVRYSELGSSAIERTRRPRARDRSKPRNVRVTHGRRQEVAEAATQEAGCNKTAQPQRAGDPAALVA